MEAIETASETPITMAELKEELKRIKKRDGALNFRAEQTEDYLNGFVVLTEKEAKAIYKKVDELAIPRLKPEHIIKLIDICPTNPDEVRTILQGYALTVTKENMKKISDTIVENMPAPKKEKVEKAEEAAAAEEAAEPAEKKAEETAEPAEKKPKKAKKKAEKAEEKAEEA